MAAILIPVAITVVNQLVARYLTADYWDFNQTEFFAIDRLRSAANTTSQSSPFTSLVYSISVIGRLEELTKLWVRALKYL